MEFWKPLYFHFLLKQPLPLSSFKAVTWREIAVIDSCVRHHSCMVTKHYLKKDVKVFVEQSALRDK